MASSWRRRISGVPGQLPLVMAACAAGGCAKGSSRLASTSAQGKGEDKHNVSITNQAGSCCFLCTALKILPTNTLVGISGIFRPEASQETSFRSRKGLLRKSHELVLFIFPTVISLTSK